MRSYTSEGRQAGGDRPKFEIDGVEFHGEGEISLMDISEFARLAAAGFDSGSPEGIGILADIYRSLLGDSEFARFRRHCRDHGTKGKVLVEILGGLIAEASDRPTSRPSDLPDGPPVDGGTARVVSLQRGTVEEKPVEEKPPVVSYG
ncbi:hypothetical protein ACIBQ1_09905 [Nonomuraea sp. NPDC050153]|uniref:hypothetical protein n=1 Tax=Nonomuraea sp. NPDC050153 TaxID=3364359 RepID=UPI00379F4753